MPEAGDELEPGPAAAAALVTCNTTGETLTVCEGGNVVEVLALGGCACSGMLADASGADKEGDDDIVAEAGGVEDDDDNEDVLLYPG